jgi:hypothetical protein
LVKFPILGIVPYSKDASSNCNIPPYDDEYIGVLNKVALFAIPSKSFQVDPVPE